jgi:hypothetical protein
MLKHFHIGVFLIELYILYTNIKIHMQYITYSYMYRSYVNWSPILYIIRLNLCIAWLQTELTSKYWTCNWSLFQSLVIFRKIIFLIALLFCDYHRFYWIRSNLYMTLLKPLNSQFCFSFLFFSCGFSFSIM